jgi:hypothetical protein
LKKSLRNRDFFNPPDRSTRVKRDESGTSYYKSYHSHRNDRPFRSHCVPMKTAAPKRCRTVFARTNRSVQAAIPWAPPPDELATSAILWIADEAILAATIERAIVWLADHGIPPLSLRALQFPYVAR